VSIEVGGVIQDRYLLTAMLGRGGMGEVFAAKDGLTGHEVAIKVVRRTNADQVLAARLEREALAARRIQSAFVPRVFDISRTEDGELFLVMQLLHGQTLSERLRLRGGVMPWEEVRPIIDDVLQGLIDAHAAGVVHRDLKPGNIFLERYEAPTLATGSIVESPLVHERAMILDFGVAKVDFEDSERLTTTGEAVGTIAYMAPEQIRGASKVDGRADLYAVAMVVFEALSGELAHDGYGQMQIVASKLERSARKLSSCALVPVPEGLEALLAKALSRRPEGRFATAQEMLRAWRGLGPATVAPRAKPKGLTTPSLNSPTETGVSAAAVVRGAMGSRLGLALATGGLVIASIVLVSALNRKPPPAPSTIAPAQTAPPVAPARATIPSATGAPIDVPVVEIDDSIDAGSQRAPRVRHVPTIKPTTTLPPITTKPRY
jgi:serine/threonine-protein kinase